MQFARIVNFPKTSYNTNNMLVEIRGEKLERLSDLEDSKKDTFPLLSAPNPFLPTFRGSAKFSGPIWTAQRAPL